VQFAHNQGCPCEQAATREQRISAVGLIAV
jgi:hypothetical protein